jgi:hypothetical protein
MNAEDALNLSSNFLRCCLFAGFDGLVRLEEELRDFSMFLFDVGTHGPSLGYPSAFSSSVVTCPV